MIKEDKRIQLVCSNTVVSKVENILVLTGKAKLIDSYVVKQYEIESDNGKPFLMQLILGITKDKGSYSIDEDGYSRLLENLNIKMHDLE